MSDKSSLKEKTSLIDAYFPINIFLNKSMGNEVMYMHWHDNIEIIYMREGYAVFYIGNESINAAPGDILFVNSEQFHSAYSIDNSEVSFYAIVFNVAILASQSPDPYHAKYISPFMDGHAIFPTRIEANEINHQFYVENLKSIINEFNEKKSAYELTIKSYLQLLVVSIYRDFVERQRKSHNPEIFKENMSGFKNLLTFIDNHYSEKISLEQAAKIVNLSLYHFCKTFKKITGRTFIEYLNLYRVNKSEELLKATDLSISQIAEKVGFCNINYFDRIFKKYKNCSPYKCRGKQ